MIHFSIKNKWQKLFTCTCIKLNAWVKRSYHDFLPSYPRRSFHLENKFYHDIYMYIIKTQGIGGNFDFSLIFFFLSGCFVCKCVLFLVRQIFPLFKQYIYLLRGSATVKFVHTMTIWEHSFLKGLTLPRPSVLIYWSHSLTRGRATQASHLCHRRKMACHMIKTRMKHIALFVSSVRSAWREIIDVWHCCWFM